MFDTGDDVIEDFAKDGDVNVLRFGKGVTAKFLSFRHDKRAGEDLHIVVQRAEGEPEEIITISKWASVENYKLSRLEFTDGSKIAAAEIDELLRKLGGNSGPND